MVEVTEVHQINDSGGPSFSVSGAIGYAQAMKNRHGVRRRGLAPAFWLAVAVLACGPGAPDAATRERISLDRDWRFAKGDPAGAEGKLAYERTRDWMLPTGAGLVLDGSRPERPPGNVGEDVAYTRPDFDDGGWRRLDLPHDWGIEGPFDPDAAGGTGKLPYYGIGWYRKHFDVPAADAGKRFYLDLDGAMSYANVWINGRHAGGWGYGYTSFRVDLTPYVQPGGDNVLAIRLDNPADSSRWYPGGGIYRNVWLVKTSPIHVGHWGTWLTTPRVTADEAEIELRVTVDNRTSDAATVEVRSQIFALDAEGRQAEKALAATDPATLAVGAGGSATAPTTARLPDPRLWSPRSPNRYVAVTTLAHDGRIVDTYDTPFGVRSFAFDAEKGFVLNGEVTRIQGTNNHHDLGALGTAVHVRALERQLEILKEMGCNALRTSHNPPAPELLDLADRMGFLVLDEAFDSWVRAKTPAGYQDLFADWSEMDLRAFVRRDRNHPSVILWSIGNEVYEQYYPADHHVGARLARIVRQEDPTRPVTAAANAVVSATNGFQDLVDVFGFNYLRGDTFAEQIAMYERFRAANPEQPVMSTESASTVSSRGAYAFPPSGRFDDKSAGVVAGRQMSSYDLYAPFWATPPDWEFQAQDRAGFVAGEFVWTGFDYLGEPTRNGDGEEARSSYFGIVDLAGFPKDRYWLYQSRWRPDLPMAHILPHWSWPERVGEITPVHVYTSGDEGELFVDGVSQGRRKKGAYEYRLRWDEVLYQPGELKVVTWKDGRPWAEASIETAGEASRILLDADRGEIAADGDLAFVTVRVADRDGSTAPRADHLLRFEISGPGEIAAVDNGDATSYQPFQADRITAFHGLALVIVRSRVGATGRIVLRATAEGLTPAAVAIATGGLSKVRGPLARSVATHRVPPAAGAAGGREIPHQASLQAGDDGATLRIR
jgi:beta-galactosidase